MGPILSIMKLAMMLTTFNRLETTRAFLSSLFEEIGSSDLFDVYILDDASTDGTAGMIKEEFPKVSLYSGGGNYFWAGGMRTLWKTVNETKTPYAAYVWLNDDIRLFKNVMASIMCNDID